MAYNSPNRGSALKKIKKGVNFGNDNSDLADGPYHAKMNPPISMKQRGLMLDRHPGAGTDGANDAKTQQLML